ncbi:hypothetical protein FHT40_002437 [Mycolicibacterium sp. BK556]|uniref:hypothetical protein n=1 Tax=unclassified Mycolicibacterium TaxID=2636767 RepID=UPI00161EE928|nr:MULTISPECIES: hypothetical protein [unclassified Mycolicibacterium]MBB3602776.1 hypothetical protein [Mycolicibacterium sp. BK556]
MSDACAVLGGSYPNYGCPPPSSFDPRTISATSGTSDDPDSALDPDGYQADQISTSPKYVPPHH